MNFADELLKNEDEILAQHMEQQAEAERQRQLEIKESIDDVIAKVKEYTKECFAKGEYKWGYIKINYRYVTYQLKKWRVWSNSYEMRNLIRDRLKELGFTHISMEVRSDLDAATVPELWIKARLPLKK